MAKRVSRDDIDRFHDYGLYLPTRTLYMGSEIVGENEESGTDALMAERIIKNLFILDNQNEEEITIIMNNLGGHVTHGLAIYDAIKACRNIVNIKVFGEASSMGSIILQAADKRIMSPNSRQLIHYGSLELEGDNDAVYRNVEESKRIDKWMEKLYLEKIHEKNPKFTIKQLKNLLKNETSLYAKESAELGLADEVLE